MKIDTRYQKLFTPLRVGSIMLRNRVIAAPITSYALEPSDGDKWESIAAKARGGASMIIIGSVGVNDTDSLIYHEASSLFGCEKKIFEEEISMIHQYGAKAEVELFHGGMFADCRGTGATPIGPDEMERSFKSVGGYERIEPDVQDITHVKGMDEADMQRVCDEFAASAVEARRMGFDVVMLHFGHGWLPAEFMSPFFNHRTDEYGGSYENRMRFPKRIVRAVRDAVGPRFPIDIRIGADEYVEGGLTAEDVARFCHDVEDLVDMVHISSGLDKLVHATSYIEAPSIHPHNINVRFAKLVKEQVKTIPVVVVGSITTPDAAEGILENGDADAIALGRPLVADPNWVNKARDNHPEDIRTCIRCVSCYGVATGGCSQGCAVNPCYERSLRLAAEERIRETARLENPNLTGEEKRKPGKKRIAVIGGGPAGMNAAIAAADQGHEVVLFEKSGELGGLLKISNTDDGKLDMRSYKNYLITQVTKRAANGAIDLRMNTEATHEMIEALAPDEIIAALGSEPRKLKIEGGDLPHVHNIAEAHEITLGQNVVIIGAGPSGCELALSLLKEGRRVTLLEVTGKIAAAGNLLYRGALREEFAPYLSEANAASAGIPVRAELTFQGDPADAPLHVYVRCNTKRITETSVEAELSNGENLTIQADDVVTCVGLIPHSEEAMSYADLVYDLRMVGDCVAPRRINEAAHEGYFAGRFI